ncbi:hypothetical protein ElyMa_005235300 [Elysia marginata]|uniref:Reverse transcriptase domain-containing protein n=1 Tax=Elysia marginata TaxID=1093978 RepID=A0AAV4JW83_9GAST|nr:hypothetical protein ElyMa_005235300 [Elysia marginata]
MRRSTEGRQQGIHGTLTSQLEDFADDIALLSHSHKQMQEKTVNMNTIPKSLEYKIIIMRQKFSLKTYNNRPLTVEDEELKDVDSFIYPGSPIYKEGGVEEDLSATGHS